MHNNEIPGPLDNNAERRAQIEKDIAFLVSLRDDFLDEVPDEIKRGFDEKKNYKVRNNWFTALVGQLDILADQYLDPVEDKDLLEEIDNFNTYCTSEDFHKAERHTEEEVQRANDLLDKMISRLEKD